VGEVEALGALLELVDGIGSRRSSELPSRVTAAVRSAVTAAIGGEEKGGPRPMEQERNDPQPNRTWPWLLILVAAGLIALGVVLWQSEAVRLIWANLWELLSSRGG
jgi:hypothetical protein